MVKGFFFLAFFLVVLPLVSGEILIGQPEGVYNIGERIELDITLKPNYPTNDFLSVSVVCGEQSSRIYMTPFNLNSGEEADINVFVLLSSSLIGNLSGKCRLAADYGIDFAETQKFDISRKLYVELDLDTNRFSPKDKFRVKGTAYRESGNNVDGFVEIRASSFNVSLSEKVRNGQFAFNFTFPENTPSGEQEIVIYVYEKDSQGAKSNEGSIGEIVIISQVLTYLEIEVDSEVVRPEEKTEINYKVLAYDQGRELIEDRVNLILFKPGESLLFEKVIDVGESYPFSIDPNSTPGYWKLRAKLGDKIINKLFYVEEIEKVTIFISNDTLSVKNIGNVEYREPIEILIGDSVQVRDIRLGVGEVKKFRLYAPDGNYEIKINKKDGEVLLGSVALTGNAISIEDIRDGFIGGLSSTYVWLLVIVVIVLIILYISLKRRKSKSSFSPDKKVLSPLGKKKTGEVKEMYGAKENASIIALKTESKKKSEYVDSSTEKALSSAKESGAKVYVDGDYKIILFSPSLTKRKENEDISVKVARKIEDIFNEHNRKFKDKILFGIGISRGQIISESKAGEFKFTTSDSSIGKAKRIAYGLGGEVLLEDSLRRNLSGGIKTEKVTGREVWRISGIADREKHAGFLNKFMHKH